ncbi:tyrosine-protein kinase receptor Tie-1-like [Dysidea avara]|uniref:tyrosine-protein kinase receptor Tie-1-like n=1 Tax=Dysidea avara TaxID=196820 RepID=UPI00332E61E6
MIICCCWCCYRTTMRITLLLLVGFVLLSDNSDAAGSGSGSGEGSGSELFSGSGSGADCMLKPCHQLCMDVRGGYICSCYVGYSLADDDHTCVECQPGYYGEDCREECNCNGNMCDPQNGKCMCNSCWEEVDCSRAKGNDCLEDFLSTVDKDDSLFGVDVPLPPSSTENSFIPDKLVVSSNLIQSFSVSRVNRTDARNLLKMEFVVAGSLDQVNADRALETLDTLVKSGEWRATLITTVSVSDDRDIDVTINV